LLGFGGASGSHALAYMPDLASYSYCLIQHSQIGLNPFRQSSHFIHDPNEDQVKLSGCGYRSIDLNAIDSANVERGAQHTGVARRILQRLSEFIALGNSMTGNCW
jgi:hypothetical protein